MNNTEPLQIVIFGGTGDLAEKKLLPALFDLYTHDYLPKAFSIIGFSRGSLTDDEYRAFVLDALTAKGKQNCDAFLEHIFFTQGDITSDASYANLKRYLHKKDDVLGVCTNKMFHLSVPPRLYEPVFNHLAQSGLTEPCEKETDNASTWTRVLVEKPFGNDAAEAKRLDILLGELFEESQIFRIDHYVAKEALQNIITFRFANSLFEPLWNSSAIESVNLKLHESFNVRDRGASYDGVGALRDVGQNHLLQMLALIAMENPAENNATEIRNNRAALLEKVATWSDTVSEYVVRGQYSDYKDAKGVAAETETETYFKVKLKIDDTKWKGVPFYIESGKALDTTCSEIEVKFQHHESCVCPKGVDASTHQNKIIFRIQPHEGISVTFWIKRPGFEYALDEKTLSFNYDEDTEDNVRLPDAYERVLSDCIKGDQTLFISTEEIQAQWKIVMNIISNWETVPLQEYDQGARADSISNNKI